MSVSQEKFKDIIKETKIPLLILDNKWHRIFGNMSPTKEIKEVEAKLSELLKKQGKLVNENKDLKKIKSNLMAEIVANMDGDDKNQTDKKLSDNKRLINEVNEKLAANEELLMDLPREIDALNKQLMLLTMEMCYDRLQSNTEDIEKIAEWVKEIRIQLKRNILKKQDLELYNAELYSYMHDIFGPEVMEIFDMKYVPSIHKQNEPTTDSVKNNEKSDNNE